MRKVKLISDGTTYGTRLQNEDGKIIPGVMRVEISRLDARNPKFIELKVTLVNVELELDALIESIDVEEGVRRRDAGTPPSGTEAQRKERP